MFGQRWVECNSLHNKKGNLTFLFQPSVLISLINGSSSTWWSEANGFPLAWWSETGGLVSFFRFFFLLCFLFSPDSWLLVVKLSPDEDEGCEKDLTCVESKGSTWVWDPEHAGYDEETSRLLGLENNQTWRPIVSPGKVRVAIIRGPTFPKQGNYDTLILNFTLKKS